MKERGERKRVKDAAGGTARVPGDRLSARKAYAATNHPRREPKGRGDGAC